MSKVTFPTVVMTIIVASLLQTLDECRACSIKCKRFPLLHIYQTSQAVATIQPCLFVSLKKLSVNGFFLCICTAPWHIAVGVFTIIGQPSKQVTLVAHKSEAVSDSGAGRRAIPWCSGLQLLPQPAAGLSHTGTKIKA